MLDKLPYPLRHAVYSFLTGAGFAVVSAVTKANGVTAVDWKSTSIAALNAGAVSAVAVVGTLWLTPLSRKYGVGSKNADTQD
jgi:hypothetical protein